MKLMFFRLHSREALADRGMSKKEDEETTGTGGQVVCIGSGWRLPKNSALGAGEEVVSIGILQA